MSARVVILGGGFAGLAAARALEPQARRGRVEVTLINRDNFMLFTPLLPEVASGKVEPRHIVQPLRNALRHVHFEMAEVTGADASRRTVSLRHPLTGETRQIAFDELVLAVGATTTTHGVPGADRIALPLKTVADGMALRNRVIGALEVAASTPDRVERDRLLRFVVVGGGFTGVEGAGELQSFVHSLIGYYKIEAADVEFFIVHQGDRLLEELPEKFGKAAAARLFDRGVRIVLNSKVAAVDGNGLELEDGTSMRSATVVWTAGNVPSPLVKSLGLPTDDRGAVKCGGDFAVHGQDHVWAIGDCAAIPDPAGGTYAPLAQNASREGPLLARNIMARLRGRSTRPFRYHVLGRMASLGHHEALAELPGGVMLEGTKAWLLWRGYYLRRLPGLGHKLRVSLDWALGAVLGSDLARLPLLGGTREGGLDARSTGQ